MDGLDIMLTLELELTRYRHLSRSQSLYPDLPNLSFLIFQVWPSRVPPLISAIYKIRVKYLFHDLVVLDCELIQQIYIIFWYIDVLYTL